MRAPPDGHAPHHQSCTNRPSRGWSAGRSKIITSPLHHMARWRARDTQVARLRGLAAPVLPWGAMRRARAAGAGVPAEIYPAESERTAASRRQASSKKSKQATASSQQPACGGLWTLDDLCVHGRRPAHEVPRACCCHGPDLGPNSCRPHPLPVLSDPSSVTPLALLPGSYPSSVSAVHSLHICRRSGSGLSSS
jgi:hypothetical protein